MIFQNLKNINCIFAEHGNCLFGEMCSPYNRLRNVHVYLLHEVNGTDFSSTLFQKDSNKKIPKEPQNHMKFCEGCLHAREHEENFKKLFQHADCPFCRTKYNPKSNQQSLEMQNAPPFRSIFLIDAFNLVMEQMQITAREERELEVQERWKCATILCAVALTALLCAALWQFSVN